MFSPRQLPRTLLLARLYSSKPAPAPAPDRGPGLGGSFATSPSSSSSELGVGELAHGTFRIAPLRRHNEDLSTMRARLLYQSRKRGILETDLLLSTFADAALHTMPRALMQQYDLFLDENDWDIYYWTTQRADDNDASSASAATEVRPAVDGEWVQTVGRVKEPYRPPPARWSDSEILRMLRAHVEARAVGGERQSGMGRMPDVRVYEAE